MNTYQYRVELLVEVDAPEENDAEDLLNDYFGTGLEAEDLNVFSATISRINE